jgi:hypothetical protein
MRNQNQKTNLIYAMFQKENRAKLYTMACLFVFLGGGAWIMYSNKKGEVQDATVESIGFGVIPAWWYQDYFGSSICSSERCAPDSDPDNDKLTNYQEFYYHSHPLDAYTIDEAQNDGELVAAGIDPSRKGKITFDELNSEESLLTESLVFQSDIEQLVAESNDISKVVLPEVKESELKITYNEDAKTYENYAADLKATMNRYFEEGDVARTKEIIKTGSDAQIFEIQRKAAQLSNDLKKIEVPFKLLLFHKYNIQMFKLMSEIIVVPDDLNGPQGELWYERVQAFLAVQQRLEFEEQSLKQTQ